MTVGDGEDLPRRADMCVNEIYDSALLGEACLPAFRHALANLLVSRSGSRTRPQQSAAGNRHGEHGGALALQLEAHNTVILPVNAYGQTHHASYRAFCRSMVRAYEFWGLYSVHSAEPS